MSYDTGVKDGSVVDAANNAVMPKEGASIGDRITGAFMSGGQGESLFGILYEQLKKSLEGVDMSVLRLPPTATNPAVPATTGAVAAPGSTQTVNIDQTLNFNGTGGDPQRVADATKKAARQVYSQMYAQGRAT